MAEPQEFHREGVGGKWDEIGPLQFDFLVSHGLKPEHNLLDIGCGSLRGGVHFIDYLEPGHYYGIEKEEVLLEAGRDIELPRYGLEHKNPNLYLIDDFDLSAIPEGVSFDFMLAQSVFTHLTPEMIELCVRRVVGRLAPGGIFYATFNRDKEVDPGEPHEWRRDERGTAKYPVKFFRRLAKEVGVGFEYIGRWNHPRGQQMLAFQIAKSG